MKAAQHRYSPAAVIAVKREAVHGVLAQISVLSELGQSRGELRTVGVLELGASSELFTLFPFGLNHSYTTALVV